MLAVRMPSTSCKLSARSKNRTETTAVTSIAIEVAYTCSIRQRASGCVASKDIATGESKGHCKWTQQGKCCQGTEESRAHLQDGVSKLHDPGNQQPAERQVGNNQHRHPVISLEQREHPHALFKTYTDSQIKLQQPPLFAATSFPVLQGARAVQRMLGAVHARLLQSGTHPVADPQE